MAMITYYHPHEAGGCAAGRSTRPESCLVDILRIRKDFFRPWAALMGISGPFVEHDRFFVTDQGARLDWKSPSQESGNGNGNAVPVTGPAKRGRSSSSVQRATGTTSLSTPAFGLSAFYYFLHPAMQEPSQASRSRVRACDSCSNAKAKCSPSLLNGACERCVRLNRECIYGDAFQRRKRKNLTRVERLEEKMDGVLALLTSNKNTTSASNDTTLTGPSPAMTDASYSVIDGSPSSGSIDSISQRSLLSTIQPLPSLSPNNAELDIIDRGFLTMAEADILLEKFKTIKTPAFPFVVVPPTTDAMTLRHESPFLFLTAMTASLEDNLSLQKKLEPEIKQVLGRRILQGEQNHLELLQGLLVHLCWNHYHFKPANKNIYLLLHMAVGIVIHMGIDKGPSNQVPMVPPGICRPGFDPQLLAHKFLAPEKERSHNAAESRALLGCFYTCSVLSVFRRQIAMKHTRWMDQCCQMLADANEYPTDILVKIYVASQTLARRIDDTFFHGDTNSIGLENDTILDMVIRPFRQQLEKLEAEVVALELQENCESLNILPDTKHLGEVTTDSRGIDSILIEHKALLISIQEVALYSNSPSTTSFSSVRNSHLWSLLTACRDLVKSSLQVPRSKIPHLTLPSFTLLWYGFLVLSKLVLLPSGLNWDRTIVRKEAGVPELGEEVKSMLESLTKTGQLEKGGDRDIWYYFSVIVKSMLSWYRRREQEAADETRLNNDYEEINGIPGSGTSPMTTGQQAGNIPGFDEEEVPTLGGHVFASGAMDGPPDSYFDDVLWQNMLDEFSCYPDMFPTS